MGPAPISATLFISLGVVGMMIGGMLAKVLTVAGVSEGIFWTNIALANFLPARSISLIRKLP